MSNNLRRNFLVVCTAIAGTLGIGTAAFADTIPANPMGTSIADTRDDVVTWVMTYGVPVLAGAVFFGIIVRTGFKWLRRVGNRAAG